MSSDRRCACCTGVFPLTEQHFRKHGMRNAEVRYDVRCKTCATRQDRINRLRRMIAKRELPGEVARLLPMSELERRHIERAVRLCGGNVDRAAEALGIGRATVFRRLKDYAKLPPLNLPNVPELADLKHELSVLQDTDKNASRVRRERATNDLRRIISDYNAEHRQSAVRIARPERGEAHRRRAGQPLPLPSAGHGEVAAPLPGDRADAGPGEAAP